jgi:hypothetical protein
VGFGIQTWIQIFVGLVAIIPSVALFINYRRTEIYDYLLFSILFLVGAIDRILIMPLINEGVVNTSISDTRLFQIHWLLVEIATLILFFHAVRLRWLKTPSFIWYTGIIWFTIIVFSIALWEQIDEKEVEYVLFTDMDYTFTFNQAGFGLMTQGGTIISSSGHDFLGVLFGIYVGIVVIYVYAKLELVSNDKRGILARRIWLYAASLWILFHVSALPFRIFHQYFNILLLLALILVSYIVIFVPEAMLLSKIQIYRASELYNKVLSIKSEKEIDDFGMHSLLDYIKNLPPNILRMLERKKAESKLIDQVIGF